MLFVIDLFFFFLAWCHNAIIIAWCHTVLELTELSESAVELIRLCEIGFELQCTKI